MLGPRESGRRSAFGGLQDAIEQYDNFTLEATHGTDTLATDIRKGMYPDHSRDRFQVFSLRYSTTGVLSKTVEIVLPVVSDGYLDSLLNELHGAETGSGGGDVKPDRNLSWEQAVSNLHDASVKLSFVEALADTLRAADLTVGVVPLVDFPEPLLSLVHSDQNAGVSLSPRFANRFIKKGAKDGPSPEITVEADDGLYVDVGRNNRPQPVEYLGAYSDIETSSELTAGMQLVVTMGDFAKPHFQSTLAETETLQTSRPTAFSAFIGETYLTRSATYNRPEVELPGAADRRPAVVWYDPGNQTAINVDSPSPPLRGSLGLLERALD